MNDHLFNQIPRLDKYVKMIARRIVRKTAAAESVEIVDPAAMSFNAPPAEAAWRPFGVGQEWGARQQWAWFRAKFTVPADWAGQGPVRLQLSHKANYLVLPQDDNFPAGPEGQAFINGQRVGAIDRQHHVIQYPFEAGQTYEVSAVFFAGRCECRHKLEGFSLALIDAPTEKLAWDLQVAVDIIKQIADNIPERRKLINAVEAALKPMDFRETIEVENLPEDPHHQGTWFYGTVAAGQAAFDEARTQIAPNDEVPVVNAIGHAHIDLAWLWPIKQSRHKCVRTFATQARLLKQYPQWKFFQSSPQAYKWIEQDTPDLYEEIRELVQAGRWDADGAAWVEFDTNVAGGEAIVRQLLYGKRYFKEKLGVDSKLFWLPDVFGYNAALPQLLKLAGVDYFITSKISWSRYNRFPFDTFRWRGIDGTEMPSHFITTPCVDWFFTYNAMMTIDEVERNHKNYLQKYLLTEPILSFGEGDGGGGPNERMLEVGLRLANQPPVTGMPRLKFDRPAEQMARIVEKWDELPVWDGELYLEFHRGTYTTHGWLKRANRKNEIRLRQLEWIASLAQGRGGYKLDKARLDGLWEDLLLMQFHDILPGSSVGEVYYDEVQGMQAKVAEEAEAMTAEAAAAVARSIDTTGFRKPLVLFNTLSWDWTAPVKLPGGAWRDDVRIPAGGWKVVETDEAGEPQFPSEIEVSADGRKLKNRFWEIALNEKGEIVSLYDRKAEREVLAKGAVGNQWQVFEDRPLICDAWDIDFDYQLRPLPGPELTSLQVVEKSAVRVAVELSWKLPELAGRPVSTIKQRLAIYASSPRIDFETTADWHEHHQVLKVAFPVDVRATEATHEIQFGHLTRPTHRNTSWDLAKFETCAHRYVDLSETGYGVALLNDCKYGHDILDGRIRLTCIKCSQAPDALADQGFHEFTYALLPHQGTLQQAGVVQAAAELNAPPVACLVEPAKGPLAAAYRFVSCQQDAVVIETVKPAEDGDGLIVRLYEAHGGQSKASLAFAESMKSVEVVNLLEEPMESDVDLRHRGHQVNLRLRPFQIVTLRVRK